MKTYRTRESDTRKTLEVYKTHATLIIEVLENCNWETQNIIRYTEANARIFGYGSLEECINEKIKSMGGEP